MALLKYFKKVSQDDVAVAASESKLTDAEENAVKQQLVVNAAEPKKKKSNTEDTTLVNAQKLPSGELRME